jgi:RNA polymerase sigma factor (sigma-70 family)
MMRRAAAGDERAWRELVRRYERLLRSIAVRMRLRDCDADDAAQLTWIALRNDIAAIREPEYVSAWLARVMRRNCIRLAVQNRREQLDDDWASWAVPDEAVSTTDRIVLDEVATVLWAAVDQLPNRERQLLRTLFDGSNRSYRDIARALHMPIGSIGPVRKRALGRLPELLATAGFSVEDLPAIR